MLNAREQKKMVDAIASTYQVLLKKCPEQKQQIEALMRLSFWLGKEIKEWNIDMFRRDE